MSRPSHLILSGGGAKGAFQVGAEKHLREECEFEWEAITGVSIGALNGVMLSMQRYNRLWDIWWDEITAKKAYQKLSPWDALTYGRGLYSNQPLWKMLWDETKGQKFIVPLHVGIVNLQTGRYMEIGNESSDFLHAVLASTAIPVLWAPVKVEGIKGENVDGGVRNISPTGTAIQQGAKEIVVINCSPLDPSPVQKTFKSVTDIGFRSLDLAMNEILRNDIESLERINNIVAQAADMGVTLKKRQESGHYRKVPVTVISPERDLGGTLDFKRQVLRDRVEYGTEMAKKVMEK